MVTIEPLTGQVFLHQHPVEQLNTDPSSPRPESLWVLKTTSGGTGTGEPYGLLLALTNPGVGGSTSYELKYRTLDNTTVGITLT